MATSKFRKVLLVDGYMREHEKVLNLSNIIPNTINVIIFEYQLLIDTWDKKMSNPAAIISEDGLSFEFGLDKPKFCQGIIGTHIVKYGESFEWTLKILEFNGEKLNIVIGLVPNKESVLKHEGGAAYWNHNGAFIYLPLSGNRAYNKKLKTGWVDEKLFGKPGDVLQIKFEWNKESLPALYFIPNGKNLGNFFVDTERKTIEIPNDKQIGYRMGVSVLVAKRVKIEMESVGF